MNRRKKPINLPSLHPATLKIIEERCGIWPHPNASLGYEIHGRYLISNRPSEKLYQAKNVCIPLVWLVHRIHSFEAERDSGGHDLDKFLQQVDGSSADASISDFNAGTEQAHERFKSSSADLAAISQTAREAGDLAYLEHLKFAFTFAKDIDKDQCRRLAIADVTRYAPLPGALWTVDGIGEALKFWHQMETPDRKSIRRDCEALSIEIDPGRRGVRRKMPD